MKQEPKQLREASVNRTVGFQDFVNDLGTHTLAGRQVPYSAWQVRSVLLAKSRSERLLRTIAARRPDAFNLSWVDAGVKARGMELVAEISG